jgi:AAA+ ATPase superfamily predicted ATPase
MFVDREVELQALHKISERRGAQFLVVYGRRRVGKTTLLIEWARRSNLPALLGGCA